MFRGRKKPVVGPSSTLTIDQVPMDKRPKHVAIIMDGNGRWAQARGLPRVEGHRRGADSVQRVLEACPDLGIEILTLYCFSSENWRRPKDELDFLMDLLHRYLIHERPTLAKNGIRLRVIGRREGLPQKVLDEIDVSLKESACNDRLTLCLAINYGGRSELADAMRTIAEKVQEGSLSPKEIDESTIQKYLYTSDLPDPDLMIRTSGEMRISNFLLWQLSYSEMWITEKSWPDFGREDLIQAMIGYAMRDRRYGGLSS